MFDLIWNLGSFIVALGILIAIHEYGHFWVARKCGVKVEKFSIGFGKTLWRKIDAKGTEFVIAAIPLGGYVKMLDERLEEVSEQDKPYAFNQKSVWARSAIIAAGPIANFLFAIVALYFMFLLGVPAVKPIIDKVEVDTPAAIMAVERPMQITHVAGNQVSQWQDVAMQLVSHIGDETVAIRLQDPNNPLYQQSYLLNIEQWQFDPDKQSPITALGLSPFRPKVLPIIAQVLDGSAAKLADLRVGDELVEINGQAFTDWATFVKLIQGNGSAEMTFLIKRDGQLQQLKIWPTVGKDSQGQEVAKIGVAPKTTAYPDDYRINLQFGLVDSFVQAVDRTKQLISMTFSILGKLFTGDVSVKNISGPISIAQGAGNSAQYGLVYFLSFLALISVNLGIMNLLPLPVLDGGHLFFNLIEIITKQPVPEKVQEVGFRIGAALLFAMMTLAIFNDIARL
ncbi:sigma E protease regulator RseP [Paraferrimonas sp. SM1919]|uniref:sigma E protease regulator RseP n=1 Tax=Paraferrimonas sp. SM1919 TaxID=2662263 RepID=UPI0013D10684|nr:sigma E protease regulator RseP [Paraferrimonas sp. SM1919]